MRNTIIVVIAAILSIGLLVFVKSEQPRLVAYTEKKPQEYMKQVLVSIFTEQGFLKSKLSANYWGYLPEIALSNLQKPKLMIYKPDGSAWSICANTGKVEQPTLGSIEQIILEDEVVLERPATATVFPIKLETRELRYQPKKQFAESHQLVTMTKPGLTITGIGLRAYLEQNSVELLQDVKTHYTLNKKTTESI